jgi:hypothetical protein
MTVSREPVNSWAIPYVTGHKYRCSFDLGQIIFEKMQIEVSQRWQPDDKYLLLNLNYTQPVEYIDVYRSYF